MKDRTSTEQNEIPRLLIDQVIGQPRAASVVRLAARQRRFVLLIGEPGTGKSLLGRAIAELLPPAPAYCVASLPNPDDPICPRIVCRDRAELEAEQRRLDHKSRRENFSHNYLLLFAAIAVLLLAAWQTAREQTYGWALAGFCVLFWLWRQRRTTPAPQRSAAKILVEHAAGNAPFIDATACSEGALFGDVRHDPFQSGGVESAPHDLVEPGAVHRAHGGVLYIDEIGSLGPDAQKLLLTAIQDKALPITGRQSGSSGTLIRSEPVPCDFVLVAAGNIEDLQKMSPALRSRLLGYGFEVLTESSMPDHPDHRQDLWRFVAQEVRKDGRIPHFHADAVAAIIDEARARAEVPGQLTTRLRELGGLVRTAGDLAVQEGASLVQARHVAEALAYAASIEEQQAARRSGLSSKEAWGPRPPALLHMRHQIGNLPAEAHGILDG